VDLHNLFPATSSVNSSRGNLEFGEVGAEYTRPCARAKRGPVRGGGPVVFEPPDEHKGNVARALFYFALRYDLQISPQQEAFLRTWNHLDPVDAAEASRNEEIFQIQGNRNPFIDQPEWADDIQDF
jgi:endonuclease I